MALVVKDRVRETSVTQGTGTFTLDGAVTGYQSFSAIGNGNTTYYTIYLQASNEWEVGIGTYTASGTTLSRDTILASSNGGSVVNFSAGTKDVFVTYPAGRSVYYDTATNVTVNQLSATTVDATNVEVTNIKAKDGTAAMTIADSTGAVAVSTNMTIGNATSDTLTVTSTVTSNLIFTDNTYDIGASGATRPRNLFLAGSATVGGNTTMTGTLTVDSTTDSTSIITGSIQTDGGMGVAKALYVGTTLNVAGAATLSGAVTLGDAAADNVTVNGTVTSNLIFTDNTYDIGASGATRPRNLFLANNATIGGLTASKVVFTDANKVLSSTGTVATDQGGTGQTSYTAGDLLYYAAGTSLTKLGIGAANTVLTSSGTAPQWSSSLTLGGTLTVTGNATFNANVTLGDATSDTITATGRLASDLIPSTDNARDLGSSSLQFRSVYAETSFVENGYNVVTQADIGSGANEIPLNQYLGSMAYQNGDSYYNIDMTVGFRNRIINGAMQIDQRNAGASVAVSTTAPTYLVDRWQAYISSGTCTFQQVSDAPANFTTSLRATTTSASSGATWLIQQLIEGSNVLDFGFGTSSAKTVTLSFWVKSSIAGVYAGNIENGSQNRSFVFNYTINTANTWEYKTITVSGDTTGTWPTGNTASIKALFSFGTGGTGITPGVWTAGDFIRTSNAIGIEATASATWQITGVQLEVGTQATPFDWRPYGTELQLCQRYCEVFASTTSNFSPFGSGYCYSTTAGESVLQYKVQKRAAPTITYDAAGNFAVTNPVSGANITVTSISTNRADVNIAAINFAVASGLTAGGGTRLMSNNTANPFINISAEL